MFLVVHVFNWYAGWSLLLAGLISGAAIGTGFHREEFLGGYASLRRRMVRLGHIALVALGMLNVLFAIGAPAGGLASRFASSLFFVGALLMPAICILTAWKEQFRHLFFIPVLCLIGAVVFVLIGGIP